jgi:hypothetical protein
VFSTGFISSPPPDITKRDPDYLMLSNMRMASGDLAIPVINCCRLSTICILTKTSISKISTNGRGFLRVSPSRRRR